MKYQRGRWNQVASYKTDIVTDSIGNSFVTYHSTIIVAFNATDITLCHGGHVSVTTKRKMNQVSNQFDLGVHVYQKAGQWFISTKAGDFAWPHYTNTVAIDRVTGVPDLPFANLAHAVGLAA